MKRIYLSFSQKISITTRFILMGLVICGLLLPLGVQAGQLLDLTATPTITESPTPIPSSTIPPTPVKEEYSWSSIPADASQLASDRHLDILAGKFIFRGLVDASSCADGGLLKNGAASPCGEAVAHYAVVLWQNQFDTQIFETAADSGIPPFILKDVFVEESQFWPATYHNLVYGGEYGLGHVTYMGVDTLLNWNPSFYKKLCNQNFNKDACKKAYAFQDAAIKSGLNGVALITLNADCANCRGGIDLQKASSGISITAATLIANRNYVEWLANTFTSASKLNPITLWRFTLVSYNAGPGCLSNAMHNTLGHGNPLAWKDVSKNLEQACEPAVDYVEHVMEGIETADPTSLSLATLDQSPAARMVLGATPTSIVETPTAASLTSTTATEPSTVSTPTALITETVDVTASETTPTSANNESATPTIVSEATSTETPLPTETLIPTSTATATPITQPTAFAPPSRTDTGEVVVKFNGLVPNIIVESAVSLAGGEIQSQVDALGLTIVSAPKDQLTQVLSALQNNMLVEYAEPNYTVQAFFTPNDPGYVNQTYLADMQIPQAWDVTQGDGVTVAVIDTGVDVLHPDLASNISINPGEDGLDANGNAKRSNNIDDDGDGYIDNWMGWNFVDNNNDVRDGNGHGTHSAGIIAAQINNAEGLAGIAPHARILAIKALDNSGFGTYLQVAQAVIYAVDHGAKVINLGFGGTANSAALLAATNYAYAHNVIVVAAGGNTASQTLIYPAANPNVIGVSAVDENLNVATFSSSSVAIQISAPGVGIYSTALGGNYSTMSGTSMSAAQVSGVAALLASQPQFDTVDKIRTALFGAAYDLGNPGYDIYYGNGLVHAFDALNNVNGNYATPTASPTPIESVTPAATPVDGNVVIMADAANSIISNYAQSCSVASYTTTLGGTGVPTIQVNDEVAGPISLGFEFWYMGTRYTNVYVSSNGWLSFNNPGAAAGASLPLNDLDNQNSGANAASNSAARPILAPLWDDLSGVGTAVASYTTAGTAPNHTFTFEWWDYQWNNGASRVSMRVILHENTGLIDFSYNPNTLNAGNSASIGITGTANNSFLSASTVGACPPSPTWSSVTETTNINTKLPSGTTYTFTPPQNPNAPIMQIPTNVTSTSMRINWMDTSSNEDGFVIYNSTDGVNYTFVTQTAANTTFYNATGLVNSANNYWRIYSVTEGALSSPIAQINAPSALAFSNVKAGSMTLNWTDNASNETGYVIYNSTDNINFTYAAQAAANTTSYTVTGLTAGTTYYWRVQAINTSAISAALTGTRTTNTPPIVTISSPANNSTFAKRALITFTGTATDIQDGNISSGLVWYSNLSGPFGTGANPTFSELIPGTHTITALSTDANGDVSTASITVTISAAKGPHGGFNGSTSECAACHRAHSAVGDTYLTTDPNSVATSDAFCLSCHNGTTAAAVSTHSNANWGTPAEAVFEVRCIQCHNSHGTSNLFAIRTDIKPSLSPVTIVSPLSFTSLTGLNSFDDNTSVNRLCVSCHTSASMNTAPHHPGGANHINGINYAGQSCIFCHPHDADHNSNTKDGFMPIITALPPTPTP